ncbi:MAG: hypothetical protein RMK91_03440 [Pseudanabaenaceae cyanobacterium SKYGB_i_bin29]|nr:hypothetical protein [Pseudanabaenaceae cyanobacterium SKYG29]MDW8420898.1 hypothetical protein [Pseudanabaenaceae cyanobacterium SKYGB_i_bin29]
MDFWEEIFADLEKREDIHRIKKLILFTCHDFWADENYDLDGTPIGELIHEMLEIIPTLDKLKEMLNSHVKKLNKQAEYFLAADAIIDTLGPVYAQRNTEATNSSDLLEEATTVTDDTSAEVIYYEDSEYDYHKLATGKKLDYIPRPFDLRAEIARQVSPLQAKILLFSALHFRFNPQDRDWSALSAYILDDLLLQLFKKCDTFASLEKKLADTADKLPNSDENRYVAAVIAGAMKSLYEGT